MAGRDSEPLGGVSYKEQNYQMLLYLPHERLLFTLFSRKYNSATSYGNFWWINIKSLFELIYVYGEENK